jgi:hypothetical protein
VKNHGVDDELKKYIVDISHRVTGYDKDVILQYVILNNNNYSILANLSIQSIYTNSNKYKKILKDLYYLDRKMKINKLIKNSTD